MVLPLVCDALVDSQLSCATYMIEQEIFTEMSLHFRVTSFLLFCYFLVTSGAGYAIW
jgi:hypothetical protein